MILNFNYPREIQGIPEFVIIGTRGCGKTVFLAALAHYPNVDRNSPVQSVDPFSDDAGKLVLLAQDILESGLSPSGTTYLDDPNYLPFYTLLIEMKPAFFHHPIDKVTGRKIQFQISCREYPGELIEDLRSGSNKQKLEAYLDDCTSSFGLLILIDSQVSKDDDKYAKALITLQRKISFRLQESNVNLRNYRIAVVFSKCEMPPAWGYRNKIETFVNLKFSRTQRQLETWKNQWKCSVKYFFCSAFGTVGKPATANVKESRGQKVIAYPQYWRPQGLVLPIYWLFTGKVDSRLGIKR